MNYHEVLEKLKDEYPDMSKNLSVGVEHGNYRIYVYQNNPKVISYIELTVYKDNVTLAKPKVFIADGKYRSKFDEMHYTKKYYKTTKQMVNFINKKLICRDKMKKLEKTPKFKSWQKDIQLGFKY